MKQHLFGLRANLLFFMLLGISACYAQKDSTYSEYGLNATAFVNQYLDFGNDDNETVSPFIITYDQSFGKFGARLGLGFSTRTDSEVPDDDNGNTSLRTTLSDLDVRVGAWRQKNLGNRWTFRAGVDLVYQQDLDKSKTISTDFFGEEVTTTVQTSTTLTGAGPFLYIQYHLTPMVSIGTEVTGYFMTGKEKFTSTNSQFPEFDDEDVSDITMFSLGAPTALFFTIRI